MGTGFSGLVVNICKAITLIIYGDKESDDKGSMIYFGIAFVVSVISIVLYVIYNFYLAQ